MTYRAKRSVVYVVGAGSSDTSTLISVLINNNNNNNNNNNDNNNNADDSGTSSSSSSHPNNDRVPSPSSSSTSSSSLSSSSSSSTSQSGIVVHEWTPTQQSTNTEGDKEEEDGVTLQVWDFNGSKAHRQVQAVTTRPPCLVIILLEVDQGDYGSSITHLTQVLNTLQAKCPGSYVIVALSQPTTTTTTTTNNNNDNDNNNNGDNKEASRRLDEIQTAVTDWGRQWTQNVEREILDIECDLQIAANNEVTNQTETSENESKPTLKEITHKHTGCLQTHLTTHLLRIHDTVLTVSTSDGQGIPELRKTVIEKATCHQLFPHLTRGVQDEISKVIEYIQDAKDAGKIMVPLGDFDDVIQQRSEEKEKPRDEVMSIYQQLQELGYILLLAQPSTKDLNPAKDTADRTATQPTRANPFFPAQFVCVNPEAFANMILGCLIEDGKKTYKLEANRFWPRDSGFKPPDPDLLARVLEILPQEGCVREAVLPILWQDYAHDQHQILHTLRCLQALGVLVFYEKSVQDCAGLAMPSYTLLSAQNTHASVLMDMIPKKKPQLNWTSKPFKDDLQVTWRMSGVTCLPTTVVRRCLAHTKAFFEPLCDYIHIWDEGVLIKFEDATIYVESVKNGNSIHVSCRVNADDADKDKTIRELWVHLATAVKVEMDFLAWQLPGVVFQTKIAIFGSVFFTARPSDSELEISLVKSLTSWRFGGHVTAYEGMIEHKIKLDVLFPFEDDTVWTPRDWIDLVLAKAQQLDMSISDRESREKLRSYRKKKNQLYRNKPSRKNRGVEVKWKAEVEEVDTKQDGGNSNAANPSPNSVSDNDVTSKTTSGDSDTPTTTTQHATLTKEEWSRKASELACQFVSCTLALAVADLVALKSQSLQGKHTDAQVTAARVTANAALAVHTGDLDAAAKAVIEAVHAAQGNPGRKGKPTSQLGGHESRLCTIL